MSELFSLENKIAIVTGGYGHLGTEMCRVLKEHGANVYVAGRDEIKFSEKFGTDSDMQFLQLDIADAASIDAAFSRVAENHGGIDILVNNAYYGAANHPERMTQEEWDKGIQGGLSSAFACIQAVSEYMKSNGGKIINIASMYGVTVPDFGIYEGREEMLNPPNYGVAKAGLLHLTKYYAKALARYKINVNAISPGAFPSGIVQQDHVFVERLEDKTPLGRIGEPEDLSGVLLLLSSSASDYITGQNIVVDGGWTV